MAVTLNSKNKRKCDVIVTGAIPELGNILGPVYGAKLPNEKIIRLVSNGRKVYEINPKNPLEKVLLTVGNCSVSVFEQPEVNTVPGVEVKPAVEVPKNVVTEKVEVTPETSDEHAEFLKRIGLTPTQWAMKSKSEKRRLKAQNEHVSNETRVADTIEKEPVEKVETVKEAAKEAEPVMETKKEETLVPVEEEVVSADV